MAGALALVLTGHAGAQEAGTDASGATKLDRILITTPLRRESSLERSTSSVTVVSEEEIKQSAASDLLSLLKAYPGVTVTANGGMGADSSISLRGTTAAQTLVLVNGVRAGSATSGTVNLSGIPLASIERIEIAKGGHSAQYGADAIGGIINIITRQGGICADGSKSCGTVTVGVTHPWGGYLSGNLQGQSDGGTNYSFGAQVLGTQGYDFTVPSAYGHEPDKDGFRQGSFNFSLSKDLDWGRVYADGLYARGRNQYDRQPVNEADTSNFSGRIGARIDHSDSWSSTVELMTALDYASNFGPSEKGDDFDTLRYGILASTQKTFEVGEAKHTLSGGVEAYRDTVDGSSISAVAYAKTERDLTGVFGQYSFEYEALTVDSGLRYDHDEQFGSATTYNIGASYELTDGLVARTSYATGFRAPTFNDLYYPDPYLSGNPDLKPERSRSYEIGLNWQATTQTSLDMAVYRTQVKDQINWAPIDPNDAWGPWHPDNIDQVQITGFEATLAHEFNAEWSGRLGIDIREPLNKSPGVHGKYVAYGDRFNATAGLTYKPTTKLELSAAVIYGRARYADAANLVKLPDYVTADFTALYALDEQSQFKFSVANIFDEQYQTKQDYRAPGRTIDLSFTRSF
ncbi:TonB-dependent receptor plug domain-containing protein [Mesorhizobium sp. A623]